MKKFIYITGIASANLMFLGAMFKVQHWPGAGVMLTLSVFLFCFCFLPFALYHSYQNSSPKKYKSLYIVTFIVFFIVFISALFKVQHWPGAGVLMFISIPIPFVLFLPIYLIQTRKDKNYSMVNFMGVMFAMTFLAVFSVLLSINVSRNGLNGFELQFINNQNLIDNLKISNIKTQDQAIIKSDELCNLIEDIKSEMLIKSNNSKVTLNTFINNADNTDIPLSILYNKTKNSNIDELKSKISIFKQAVISSDKISPELKELSEKLFNVEDKVDGDKIVSWESNEFSNYYLVVVLDALTRLEYNVMFVEHELSSK